MKRRGTRGRMRPRAGRAALALGAVVAACARAPAPPTAPEPAPLLGPAPAAPCRQIARIEVHKGSRRLLAHCDGGRVVALPIALGREPEGDKRSAGDARTPEGAYRISGPPRRSRFHLFLPFDYPSVADAEAALADGRLSRAGYRRIVAAHARGEPPPDDTAIGGELGFHGEGARWRGDSRWLDWTFGCVALSDADAEFIALRSAVGTPVEILP